VRKEAQVKEESIDRSREVTFKVGGVPSRPSHPGKKNAHHVIITCKRDYYPYGISDGGIKRVGTRFGETLEKSKRERELK